MPDLIKQKTNNELIEDGTICYKPNQDLLMYMQNLLHLLDKKKKLDAGGKRSDKSAADLLEIQREDQRLRTQKSRKILPEIIFPSVANILFFFEAIDENQDLKEVFESDIKELLGVRRLEPNLINYGEILIRLVASIISSRKGIEEIDFRVKLMHGLHKLIQYKMQSIGTSIFWTPGSSKEYNGGTYDAVRYISQDIGRAVSWTGVIASKIADEYEEDFKILSEPISILKENETLPDLSTQEEMKRRNKIQKDKEIKFKKAVSKIRPKRSIVFDTNGLLQIKPEDN